MRKVAAWMLAGCLMLGLTGCGEKENAVYVQSVASLMQMGGIAAVDRFSGLVISESVTEIQKDGDKTIDVLFVREGDDVEEGQKLFSYDTEELQLELEKQQLQREQLIASIDNYKIEIEKLEAERERANSKDILSYTVQIQSNQIDLKEAELNLKTKEGEVKKSMHILENAVVTSPVTGRVTAINENGTDSYGNPQPYITIQKAGSYRVKATLNEMQRGTILEGDRILLESRVDPNQSWTGTVSLVDYENPSQGNNQGYYGNSDAQTSSSRYPFYIELDDSEGLLLGQHLYVSLSPNEMDVPHGLTLGSAFVCFDEEGEAFVWAEGSQGKLEKRMITLSGYFGMSDVYEIEEGLSESDYVAFPEEDICAEGVRTTRTQIGGEGGVN